MTLSGLLLYLNVFPPLSNHVTSTSITLGQRYGVLKGLGDVDRRVIRKTHVSSSQDLSLRGVRAPAKRSSPRGAGILTLPFQKPLALNSIDIQD